jgi:hypothetical protein
LRYWILLSGCLTTSDKIRIGVQKTKVFENSHVYKLNFFFLVHGMVLIASVEGKL